MINQLNKKLARATQAVGLEIHLPKPTKKRLSLSSKTNTTVGISLLVFGIITTNKWSLILGGTALVSGVIMGGEASKKYSQ